MAWMNFFIFYVSLSALFYRILAKTSLEQLARVDFVFATRPAMTSIISAIPACLICSRGRSTIPCRRPA